jgi:hypothetical protein
LSSEDIIVRFKVSEKSRKNMVRILYVSAIVAAFFLVMYFVAVSNENPTLTDVSFSLDDDETKFIEVTVEEGQSIYYKVESDEFLNVRLMTYEEYTDLLNSNVYSYIEDDFTDSEDKKTGPLEAGVYVFYLKGSTDHANGVLSYGVSVDKSDKEILWLAGIPLSLFAGLLLFLIYGMIADARFSKHGK